MTTHRMQTTRWRSARWRSRASSAVAVDAKRLAKLEEACQSWKKAPPSEKLAYSKDVAMAFDELKNESALPKWGRDVENLNRRNVFLGELRKVGIKQPEVIGKATARNEAAFLATTVGTTSLLALFAGQLPGDWGFFVPFLTAGTSLVVLAIGSTNPGALKFLIDRFSLVFPDYRERVTRHEAAHFLTGYLLGFPVTNYNIMIGKARTEFVEARLQKRLYGPTLEDYEVNQFAVLAMAGAASEAMKYNEVQGQDADLNDLQRILNCSKKKLSKNDQLNMTRWAVYNAASMLHQNVKEYQALQDAMGRGASVPECAAAIEAA